MGIIPSPISCPVCSLVVKSSQGLSNHLGRRRKEGDLPHTSYLSNLENSQWEGKIEGTDYIHCKVCNEKMTSIVTHVPKHGITVTDYRLQFGSDVKIRCDSLVAKRSKAIASWTRPHGETKTITCPDCSVTWEGSKYLVPGTHDLRCVGCKDKYETECEDARWLGKLEDQDYVICRACGHRAEGLTAHIQNVHPELVGIYKERYPGSELFSMNCAIHVSPMLGKERTEEFCRKVSEGKKNTHYCHSPESRNKMSKTKREQDLKIRFTLEDLLPYKVKYGKVSLTMAIEGLGSSIMVVKRECARHGLDYYKLGVKQDKLMVILSNILNSRYVGEWTSLQFVNPQTNKRFKFDGYFESHSLLVEFQGYQHYTFPNRYMNASHEDVYQDQLKRDLEKRHQVLSSGTYKYLEVREDEPWEDTQHLRRRLKSLGIDC